jgi:flagellar biogenesis protein FliO
MVAEILWILLIGYFSWIFHRINPKFADFFEKTCVLKNLAGFSYKKPQVLLKKTCRFNLC